MSLVHITQIHPVPRLPVIDWELGRELEELVRTNAEGWTSFDVTAFGRGFNAHGQTVDEVEAQVGDRTDDVITLHINANAWENDGADRLILDARVLTADSPEAGGGIQTTDKTLFNHYQQELLELTKRAAKRAGGAVPARTLASQGTARPAWVIKIPKPALWVKYGPETVGKIVVSAAAALLVALILWLVSLTL